nr:zinc knuckle CX2CX4HX4C [Tanacetum cinerariifolium]
ADLVDVVTISIPSLTGDDFIKETIRVEYEWRPPSCDKNNDGFQKVGYKKKKKGHSKFTNGSQFVGLSVKQNLIYEPMAATSEPNKGATNVGNKSKSSSMVKSTGNYSKKGNITTSNSSLPTELKELPTKFNKLAEDVKGLKNQFHKLEIELPGDLKEISTKLEDFTKSVTSLTSQDTLDKLNDLANKKRKHADDIHDYFRANKKLKSSVQYEDHLDGTMLNKPVLDFTKVLELMIMSGPLAPFCL